MGRRNRKRERSIEDTEGDLLERAYLVKRQQRNSQKKTNDNANSDDKNDNSNSNSTSNNNENKKDNTTNNNKEHNENVNINQKEKDEKEIQRQRLKKQRKKEAQKKKKKEATEKLAKEMKRQQEQKEKKQEKRNEKKKKKDNETEKLKTNTFIKTHKGVLYNDIVIGKGPVVQDRKKVRVSYKLRAVNKTGKVIDSSSNFGFRMGKGEVISGWEIGLLRMKQGGTRHLIVPPGAGYGNRNIGAGSGALLYFEITLLSC
jgi:FKBP-type peptidyl-prolyl cis-trans isomerase